MRTVCRDRGYSLYELIVTTTVAAIVVSVGVPSFGRIVAEHRLRAEVDALFHGVHLARKESVLRRRAVTLCPTGDGVACQPHADWSQGWMMFVNLDRDQPAARDPVEPVLHRHTVGSRVRITANRHSFSFRTTALRATNGTLVVCDHAHLAEPRALVVSYTGRPRVARRDSRGDPYDCRE